MKVVNGEQGGGSDAGALFEPFTIDHSPFTASGAVAQLGEHLLCKQGVVGSIPSGSTNILLASRRWDRSSAGKKFAAG